MSDIIAENEQTLRLLILVTRNKIPKSTDSQSSSEVEIGSVLA